MLENTGERFLPALHAGQIQYEHLHRYAVCLSVVSGKVVLDIASGEGYGSALLAQVAREVTGVDISQEAITYAGRKYSGQANLRYLRGSCAAIPLPDQSVEVVTSFETIEHHEEHDAMMQEIKRVLKPGGLLIISSPNKLVYSDIPKYENPFHVKELYYDGFTQLLGSYFSHSRFFGQRLAVGSFIYSLSENGTNPTKALPVFSGDQETLTRSLSPFPLPDTLYFLAVCSDVAEHVERSVASLYLDGSEDILKGLYHLLDEERKGRQQDYANHLVHESELNQHINSQQEAFVRQEEAFARQEKMQREMAAKLQEITESKAWKIMQAMWNLRRRLKI